MMRVLDLFCGAGGAAMGYHRAGFEVVGVDIEPQPNYPFRFVQTDALRYIESLIDLGYANRYDLIHASPPCQAYSTLRHSPGASEYADLVDVTRNLLDILGRPYVIENVPGAPLWRPITLCGSMFDLRSEGFELRRHRLFETKPFGVPQPVCDHLLPVLGVYGDLTPNPRPSTRGVKAGHENARQLMGIDWMTTPELVQAIPPAYTEHIGRAFAGLPVDGQTAMVF